jgi:adenylyl-sulfate kinase
MPLWHSVDDHLLPETLMAQAPDQPVELVWHEHLVSRLERASQKRQRPCVLWFTGLSGAGKSTLANARGHHTYLLDGDNVRKGLNRDLGFSDADRVENIRRIGEVAKLFADAGMIIITAFISPFRADRDMVRGLMAEGEFIEVFVSTPIDICEQRDPKGMYAKARRGEIKYFTGIDSPYEAPLAPELVLDAASHSVDDCVNLLIEFLAQRNLIQPRNPVV